MLPAQAPVVQGVVVGTFPCSDTIETRALDTDLVRVRKAIQMSNRMETREQNQPHCSFLFFQHSHSVRIDPIRGAVDEHFERPRIITAPFVHFGKIIIQRVHVQVTLYLWVKDPQDAHVLWGQLTASLDRRMVAYKVKQMFLRQLLVHIVRRVLQRHALSQQLQMRVLLGTEFIVSLVGRHTRPLYTFDRMNHSSIALYL